VRNAVDQADVDARHVREVQEAAASGGVGGVVVDSAASSVGLASLPTGARCVGGRQRAPAEHVTVLVLRPRSVARLCAV